MRGCRHGHSSRFLRARSARSLSVDRACELIQMLPPLQERTSNRPSEGRAEMRERGHVVVVVGRLTARSVGRRSVGRSRFKKRCTTKFKVSGGRASKGRTLARFPPRLESFIDNIGPLPVSYYRRKNSYSVTDGKW